MFSLVQRPHGILYKAGYCTSQKKVHRFNATSQTQFQFSLSIQLDQNHNKLRKLKNTSQTLTVSEANSSQINEVFISSQRFMAESSSLSRCLCNSSITFVTRSSESDTITEAQSLRRRGKEIQRIWTGEAEERTYRFIFGIQPQNQQKQNQDSRISEGSDSNLRLKPR